MVHLLLAVHFFLRWTTTQSLSLALGFGQKLLPLFLVIIIIIDIIIVITIPTWYDAKTSFKKCRSLYRWLPTSKSCQSKVNVGELDWIRPLMHVWFRMLRDSMFVAILDIQYVIINLCIPQEMTQKNWTGQIQLINTAKIHRIHQNTIKVHQIRLII